MSARFQELDYRQTPMGELTLRARASVSMPGTTVYEVKLDNQHLMSSLVNQSEMALARLALEQLKDRDANVLIGGLGLGYTAVAALAFTNVRHVRVIESLQPIIDWHHNRLVPAADQLVDDPRCELIRDDFFQLVADVPAQSGDRYDAILVDIDHSPDSLLDPAHQRFYSTTGLEDLSTHLTPTGIFALWSAEPPAETFLQRLRKVFAEVQVHAVPFYNPLLHVNDENTVVIARRSMNTAAGSHDDRG